MSIIFLKICVTASKAILVSYAFALSLGYVWRAFLSFGSMIVPESLTFKSVKEIALTFQKKEKKMKDINDVQHQKQYL